MTDVSEPVQAASTSTPNDSFIIPKRARRPTSRSRSSSRSSDPDSRQRGSGDAEGEKRSKSRRRRRAPKRGGDHVSKRRRRSRSRSLSRSRNRTTSASDGSELSRVFRRDLSREVVKIVLLGASMERYFRELRALLDREGISHSNRYLNNQAIKDVIRDTGEQGIDYIMILGNENEKNRNVSLKIISDPDPRQSVKIPLNEVCGLILEREKKLGRSIYLPAPAADMLQPPAAAGFSRPSRIESHVSYPPRGSLMGPYSAPESLMPPGPPIHYRDTRDSVSLPEFHGGAAPPVRSRFPPENLHRPSMNQSYNLPPDDYRRSEYLGMPQRGGYPSRENVGGYGVPQPLHMPHESVRFSQYPQPLHNGSSMERSGYPPSGYANPYPMTNDVRSPESNAAARPYVPSNNVQSMGASSASSTGSGTVDAGSITNLLNYLKTATSVLGPSAADQNPGVYDRNQGQSSMHHFGVSEATGMQPRVSQSRDPRRPH